MTKIEQLRYDHKLIAKKNYKVFFKQAWRILEPETKLLWNWHHSLIAEYLQAVRLGQIRRLIINIAPRTTKSLMATVCFPCWWWAEEPHIRFLFGSYAGPLATKHSVLRRNIIESPWYQWAYPNVQLTADTNMKTEFKNTATGFMKAAGIKAGVTGEGGDCLIIDDPHNPKGAESEVDRETTLNALDLMWTNRLNNKKTGRIVLIMQRLHGADATAHLMQKELGYEHLKIPTIAEGKTVISFPISKKKINRKDGDLLHPERDGPPEIEQAKKDLGSYGFAGQHQQNPVPREGAMIKSAWLRYYKVLPDKFDERIQSWDLAFKGTERSDFVVGTLWGRIGGQYYLIDLVRGQWGFPETIAAFRAFSAKHPYSVKKVVEAKANGAALIDTLKKEIPGIIPFEPKASKEERVAIVAPAFESGNVFIPESAPWTSDYVTELTIFPMGQNDDQVDSTSQAIMKFLERRVIDWAPVSLTAPSKWR